MKQKVITIIGGTGFVGRYVVTLLAKAGYTIRVISRHADAALPLKTAGDVGQIVLMSGDITQAHCLQGMLDHSYGVINLAGILYASGKQTFESVHTHGTEKLAQMAKAAGAKRFIHISALGVDKATGAHYARSKIRGEKAVLAAFPQATILRPSVIFGAEDNFFNQFAAMASISPVLPLIGGGKTQFQPVYVGDVAHAIEKCLTLEQTQGQTYELGGPHVYSFRQLMEYMLHSIGKKRALLSIPTPLASLMGTFGQLLPKPPLTRDQVRLLKYPNIVSPHALNFAHLGIGPTALELIVPEYLARFCKNPDK